MKYELVIVENLAFDVIRTPKNNKTVKGGSAYYALFSALLFSKKVGLVSVVGEDFNLEELKNMGLDTKGTKIIKGGRTLRIHVFYSDNFKNRKVTYDIGVAKYLNIKLFPKPYLNAKIIFLPTSFPPRQVKFAKFLKKISKARLAIDTIEHYIEAYPKEISSLFSLGDIIFLNEKEYKLVKRSNLLKKLENKELIIKKGSGGANYIFNKYECYCPALKVKLVDPTGAGDCLASVFLILRAKGWSIEASLKKAVKLASLSVEDFGVEHIRNSSCLNSF